MSDTTVVVCTNCGRKNRVPAAAKNSPSMEAEHRALPQQVLWLEVRRWTQAVPVPAATGFTGSSCHATTRTFAMRRPCFTISARARVSRGPTERR